MSVLKNMRFGEAILAAFTLSLGAFIAIQTWMTPPIAAQSVVGPGLFPAIVAVGLVFVGLRLCFEAFLRPALEEEVLEIDWIAMSVVAVAFASQYFLLEPLGWIISGTILFVVSAIAFGSRKHIKNLVFGLLLTGVTFVVFDYGLDLDLPTGSLIEDFISAPA